MKIQGVNREQYVGYTCLCWISSIDLTECVCMNIHEDNIMRLIAPNSYFHSLQFFSSHCFLTFQIVFKYFIGNEIIATVGVTCFSFRFGDFFQ